METIHKLRGRTGAIGNTVTKLFKRKHYKRKSKELKQPVTVTDGGMYVVSAVLLEFLIGLQNKCMQLLDVDRHTASDMLNY